MTSAPRPDTDPTHTDPTLTDPDAARAGAARPRLRPSLADKLDRLVARSQRDWHSPAVSAGLVRDGHLVWSCHVGQARLDPATAATDHTPYMIGSITKTVTALTVMSLRDEGRLTLDDTVGRWYPRSRHAAIPVRQLLAHASGLQREPVGDMWSTLQAPDAEALDAGLDEAEQVLPAHHAFHYSNLAYGLLGRIVERETGSPWEAVVRERILDPLGMTRTGLTPGEDRALGYLIDPYTGVATEEPLFVPNATAALGGLWSCVADLTRYASFLADPAAYPQVIAADTVAEMCRPIIMSDPDGWTGGYGLGFGMRRRGERVYVGHGGAMPGYLAGVQARRADNVGAVAFANCSANADPVALAGALLDEVLDAEPTGARPWRPERPDDTLGRIAGLWWSEGAELVFYVEDGQLWSRLAGDLPLDRTRYRQESPTRFRAVEGRERGERLEVTWAQDGSVASLSFAGYPVTRSYRG